MTDIANQMVSTKSNEWSSKMLEHLRSILDNYMKKIPQHEELIAFMEDEKQMYDPDGKPSAEYLKLIDEFSKQCATHPIDIEEIAKEDDLDLSKIEVLKGAKDFLDKQKELMKSFREASDKEAWINSELGSEEKREAFDKLVEESTNNALNNVE